jgi:hypothetical protein
MLRSTLRFISMMPVLVVLCVGALRAQDSVGHRTPAKHTPSPLVGAWGGRGMGMIVTDAGAALEFDCAHGTIDQAIRPNRSGRFTAPGSFTAEKPGPVGAGPPPPAQRARYTGQIRGKQMTITGALVKSRRKVGPYLVTHSQPPRLTKCL